jgi:hypothetical protein
MGLVLPLKPSHNYPKNLLTPFKNLKKIKKGVNIIKQYTIKHHAKDLP